MRTKIIFSAAAFFAAFGASNAHACSSGFLADLACRAGIIDQRTANTLDGIHAGLGNPLDHAAPAIAEWAVPGSGAIIGGVQQLNSFGGTLGGGFQPAPAARPMPEMGNYCLTPSGEYGPGPVYPVGSSCAVDHGFLGVEFGYVIR
jgi:hypothetical protein